MKVVERSKLTPMQKLHIEIAHRSKVIPVIYHIHLRRIYDGPGIRDLTLLKAKQNLQAIVNLIELSDDLREYILKLFLGSQTIEQLAINMTAGAIEKLSK